jgi:uncharacterized protein
MTGFSTLIAAAGLAMAAFVPMAQTQNSADEANNKAIVQRSFDAWAAGTGTPYDLLAEDAIWTIAGNSLASKTYPSRAAFIGEVIQPFVARMSVGLKPVIREIHADGSTVIVHFDAAGTAKDGKPYINTYAWFLDLRGGKIVKATAFYDSVAFNDLWTRVQPE